MAAFKEVDGKSILISGLAGAAFGELSAIGSKGAQLAITTGIDATEKIIKKI